MITTPPNGLELSCPATQASSSPFSRIPAGRVSAPFRQPAGVSSSQLLGGEGVATPILYHEREMSRHELAYYLIAVSA